MEKKEVACSFLDITKICDAASDIFRREKGNAAPFPSVTSEDATFDSFQAHTCLHPNMSNSHLL